MARERYSKPSVWDAQRIKSLVDDDPLEEVLRFEQPLGLPLHVYHILLEGVLTHVCMAYSVLYLWPMGFTPLSSIVFDGCYGYISVLGITVGAHRYWTHRAFKANKPLQVLLMLMQTMALQTPIFNWCRNHRIHHKFTDTDADPHNAARGFWFSHITWLFHPRHPETIKKFKTMEISDLARDPIVRFQSKHYWKLVFLICFVLPMSCYCYLFPEFSWFQIFISNMTRFGISKHFTFLVNSAAHKWGDKPYDKGISASENKWVSIVAVGEGWHNYHHTFPWDYKAAELGYRVNLSTVFIHFFAKIGWAWDLQTVSHKLLVDRINRTGDGSHKFHRDNDVSGAGTKTKEDSPAPVYWGWGDKELRQEDVEITETVFPAKNSRG